MQKIVIPREYNQVMPYLIVKNAAGFLQFVVDVFDGAERTKHMRDELTIMHGEVCIGESVIMFADCSEPYAVRNAGLFVYVDDADTIYQKALDAGATPFTPLSNQPYGRSGGVIDIYGNTWWITSV